MASLGYITENKDNHTIRSNIILILHASKGKHIIRKIITVHVIYMSCYVFAMIGTANKTIVHL